MWRSSRTWFLCCGLLSLAVMLAAEAEAWAWPRDKERKRLEVDLQEVLNNPGAYLNRTIRFRCRFAMNGNLFKHLNSPFNSVEYVNFAVWTVDARLWEKEARKSVLPTLYLNKIALAEIAVLRDCQRYEVLWLTGEVVSVYSGLPWVRVEKVEKDKDASEVVNDATLAHLSEGMALLEQNQASLAIKHLEMALAGQVPQRHKGVIFGRLAEARVKAGDVAGGMQAYEEALKHKPDDVEILLAYSRALLLAGRSQQALENAQRVIALSGEKPEAYGLAAEAYARLGQIRKGVEQCDLAAALAGNSAEDRALAEVHRARVLAQGKRYADAVRVYAAVVQDTPLAEAPWLHKEIGNLYESRFDETGDVRFLEEADRQYRKASVFAGNADAEALTSVARALFKKAKAEKSEFKDAREWVEKARAVEPRYLAARLLSAEIALADDNAEEARAIVDAALAEDGESAAALLTMAELYEKVGKIGEARDLLGRVAAQQPANRLVLERHIALCERTGDLAGARRSYAALLALSPGDAAIALKAAGLHLQAGDAAAAEAALAQAGRDAKATAQAQALLGKARLWQGNERGAESAFRAALASDPQNVEALARLALLLADQNRRPTEALGLAQRARDLAPANPLCLDALAAAQIRSGKPAEALVTLQRIANEQMTCSSWYHLGMARLATGDNLGAREALEQAIAIGGSEAGAATAVEKSRSLLQQIAVKSAQKSSPAATTAPQPESPPAVEESQPEPAPAAPGEEEKNENTPAEQAPAEVSLGQENAAPREEFEEEAANDIAALRGEAGARNQVTAGGSEVPILRAAEVAPEIAVEADDPPATQPAGQGALAVPAGKQIMPREFSAENLERLAKIEVRSSAAAPSRVQAPEKKSGRELTERGEEITDLPDWAK